MATEAQTTLELVSQPTPMDLLHLALTNNAAIDVIERLATLQKQMREEEAVIAFNDALSRAQGELGRVAPDLNNPQTKSKYASYATLDRVVRPVYTTEGFSLSFNTAELPPEIEMVRVLCYVSHRGGHTRQYQVDMPADGKGAKGGDVMTKTHARGAAASYGMRYLLKMIFNVAVGEDDTDGNVSNGELGEKLEWIAACRTPEELQRIFKNAFEEFNDRRNYKALGILTDAKNKRKAELSPKAGPQ